MDNYGKCDYCGNNAPFKCTACKIASYCSAEHQKKHWKAHKSACRPLEIAHCAEMGRFAIASRDIKAKTVLFCEAPIALGPKWCLEEQDEEMPVFPCVGCFKPVVIGTSECLKCGWPACSAECEGLKDPHLHGLECAILSKGPARPAIAAESPAAVLDYYRSDALLALRCLPLFSKYPQKWKQLQELQSHDEQRKGTKYYEEAETRIVSYLKARYLDRIKAIDESGPAENHILPDCSAEQLHRICGILEVNALNISLPSGQEISSLYPTACLLEHSCTPNCYFTFDFAKNFKITMIAARDIRRGEHLSIMYTHMLWGTQMRQEHLMLNKYFICTCQRCTDPTELGTYISALKCIGADELTCIGTMLPADPTVPNTDWICDTCPVRIANDQVDFLMSNIEHEVDTVMMNATANIDQLEGLIEKLKKFLHDNHYHIFALKHSLIQLYGSQSGYITEELSDELLERKIVMCHEMLDTVDVIDPHAIRLSMYTGIILYELHLACVEMESRKLKAAKLNGEPYDYEELYNAERYLGRAKSVLENNLDIPQGKKLIEAVVKASAKLETLFENIKL